MRRIATNLVIAIAALVLVAMAGAQGTNSDTPQQPGSAQPVVSPSPVITQTTREEFLRSIPGEIHVRHRNGERHRNVEEEAEELNRRERESIEEANERARRQRRAIRQAGGWSKAYLAQLDKVIQLMPSAADKLEPFKFSLGQWAFCTAPAIFSEESMFNEFIDLMEVDFPRRVDNFNLVQPLADVIIDGCAFGPQAGTVQLVLGSTIEGGGQTLPLQVFSWDDFTIEANLPDTPGIPDQAGQLVVTDIHGNQTSFPVQFFQRRVAAVFSVDSPNAFIAVASTHQTTSDDFRDFNFTGTDGSLLETDVAANHYTFCCSTVHGVDEWFIKLSNGWTIPTTDQAFFERFETAHIDGKGNFVQLQQMPFTNCGLFSSGDGEIDNIVATTPPNIAPYNNYQSEVDVYWTVGSNCSGIAYDVRFLVWGPEGIPFK